MHGVSLQRLAQLFTSLSTRPIWRLSKRILIHAKLQMYEQTKLVKCELLGLVNYTRKLDSRKILFVCVRDTETLVKLFHSMLLLFLGVIY